MEPNYFFFFFLVLFLLFLFYHYFLYCSFLRFSFFFFWYAHNSNLVSPFRSFPPGTANEIWISVSLKSLTSLYCCVILSSIHQAPRSYSPRINSYNGQRRQRLGICYEVGFCNGRVKNEWVRNISSLCMHLRFGTISPAEKCFIWQGSANDRPGPITLTIVRINFCWLLVHERKCQ